MTFVYLAKKNDIFFYFVNRYYLINLGKTREEFFLGEGIIIFVIFFLNNNLFLYLLPQIIPPLDFIES